MRILICRPTVNWFKQLNLRSRSNLHKKDSVRLVEADRQFSQCTRLVLSSACSGTRLRQTGAAGVSLIAARDPETPVLALAVIRL